MAKTFHKKIQSSLSNSALQSALDGNAERRRAARTSAYASLPVNLAVMRQRAHEVRENIIHNLEQHLENFSENAKQNGMIVHHAADAETARNIVLDIAHGWKAKLVAKSKTMVGEEIKINSLLESNGIKVVETDLGEYIVQLRGEPPAHIITPAVHLSRGDVARTFQEHLGVPFNEDIPVMTETARKVLRESFLDADIGISGVNFGVVEDGTICIVTNEGNGRMVTTLPPVHIALMGIERLVPSMDDLALMLYLLPRSATGQKMTVYTNLIKSPRRLGETDGPIERHLILVDNGRIALQSSNLAEILCCIRCGACINACPVFREIGGHAYIGVGGDTTPYPGPIGSVVSPGLFGQAEFGQLARATSLCGACKEACPIDIDLPKLLLRVRAGGLVPEYQANSIRTSRESGKKSNAPRILSLALAIYGWIASSKSRYVFIQKIISIVGRLLSPVSDWIRLPGFTGWGYKRDFPAPAGQTFRERFKELKDEIDLKGPVIQENAQILKAGATGDELLDPHETIQSINIARLIQQFKDELTQLGGSFHLTTQEGLTSEIIRLIQGFEVDKIQAWESDFLPAGLILALQNSGVEVTSAADPGVKVGLTGALAAVAESGTILESSGEGKPQTASLLPEIHVVILQAEAIYSSLNQVLSLTEIKDMSSAVLISGPSRTADIEMTLTIGVHGPGQVHVVCVD